MAEQQAVEGEFSSVTFFGTRSPKFPAVNIGDQLQTDSFLEASKQILPFFDKLGKAFGLVKKDVQGNIEKIEKHQQKGAEKYKTINAIVEEDQSAEKKGFSDGCVGVLWLKRGLEFINGMFVELLADVKNGVTDENMSPVIMRAYDKTLKQFHGWMTQKMIGGVAKFVPYRKDFFASLSEGPATTEMVLKDIELYSATLGATVLMLDDLLTKNNKNPQEKV